MVSGTRVQKQKKMLAGLAGPTGSASYFGAGHGDIIFQNDLGSRGYSLILRTGKRDIIFQNDLGSLGSSLILWFGKKGISLSRMTLDR